MRRLGPLKKFFLILFISFLGVSGASSEVLEKVLAVVDGEMISLSYLKSYRRLLSTPYLPSHVLFDLRSKNALKKSRKKLLAHLIDEKVLKKALPENLSQISSEDEAFESFLKEKNFSKKRLKKKLGRLGLSFEDYKMIVYQSSLLQRWVQMEVADLIHISNEALEERHFKKTKRPLFQNSIYELHQWNFKSRVQAQKFKPDESPLEPELKSLSKKQMSLKLRKVILPLKTGEISKPFCPTASRCHIFELLNKTAAGPNSPQIRRLKDELFKDIFLKRFKAWAAEKRTSAFIKKY